MNIVRLISNDEDLRAAHDEMGRLLNIGDARRTDEENGRLGLLSVLVRHYEDEHYPLDMPDPVDTIMSRMADLGLQQADLLAEFGNKSTASQMLSRSRPLTLPVIRRLSARLSLPIAVL